MSNKKNKPLMPKLRFPAFRNSPEWISEKVDRLVDTITPPKKLPTSSYAVNGDFPIIDQSQNAICGWTDDREALIKDDLPLIIFGDHTCILKLLDRPFAQGADGIKILKPRPRIGTSYLYQYLSYRPVVTEEYKRHYSILKEKVVLFPDFKTGEQQKIADCLSSLDELIVAQARKVDALKTHKKGLMQQLFPREGETQPRLRFPEFRDAGAWSKRKLSNFLTERSQFPENKVPLYSLTIEDGVTPKTERYERAFLVNDEAEAYKLVLPNDFAFNPMNLRFGAIGRHSGTEAVAVSKYYNIFYCDNSVDSRFCDIYFRSDAMVRFYDTMAIGSLIEKRRVHFSDFLKFNIRFPSSLEQQRIADCIASLDTLITATIQELEALKIHKKGLMQQLFPQGETLS